MEHLSLFADVPAERLADGVLLTRRLVNMSAVEIRGLMLIDEFANRRASEVLAFARAIELRIFGRRVTDENQGIEIRELLKPRAQLLLRVFAGCVERRGIRIAETSHRITLNLDGLPVKIMEAVRIAEAHDI